MQKIYFHHACLVTTNELIDPGYLYVQDGRIMEYGPGEILVSEDTLKVDLKGRYLSPGFIDLHVHGGGGHDFMDGTLEAFLGVARTHVRYGTTAMCPTSLTGDTASIYSVLDQYAQALKQNTMGSEFLGIHLEGPYLAMSQRGAQDPKYIRDPLPEEYRDILAHSPHIIRWSAAPEHWTLLITCKPMES